MKGLNIPICHESLTAHSHLQLRLINCQQMGAGEVVVHVCVAISLLYTRMKPGCSKAQTEWVKIRLAAFRSPVNVGRGCGLARITAGRSSPAVAQKKRRRGTGEKREAVKIL